MDRRFLYPSPFPYASSLLNILKVKINFKVTLKFKVNLSKLQTLEINFLKILCLSQFVRCDQIAFFLRDLYKQFFAFSWKLLKNKEQIQLYTCHRWGDLKCHRLYPRVTLFIPPYYFLSCMKWLTWSLPFLNSFPAQGSVVVGSIWASSGSPALSECQGQQGSSITYPLWAIVPTNYIVV